MQSRQSRDADDHHDIWYTEHCNLQYDVHVCMIIIALRLK